MNCLVTAIGSFSADVVIKKLKEQGHKVVGCNIYPKEWIIESYEVDKFYQSPYANDSKYLDFLKDICKKEKINVILPLTDVEVDVLNKNRKWFEKNGVILCISSEETIDICRDKTRTYEVLLSSRLNINTIETTRMEDADIKNLSYPIVCKLINGRSSQGLNYIYNEEEFKLFKKNHMNENYLVQPYIDGTVVTCDILRNNDNEVVVVPRKELLRTPNGAGVSVYVYDDEDILDLSKNIANLLNIKGCVNFEFLLSQGKYYFLECNPRFSGGVEFSCMGSGYDFVNNHLNVFLNKKIELNCDIQKQYLVKRYEEYSTSIDKR